MAKLLYRSTSTFFRKEEKLGYKCNNIEMVYNMIRPKPKELLLGKRELIRHGELGHFSCNTVSQKSRYFFLFTDCLLLTKKKGNQKYRLKLYIHLNRSIKIITLGNNSSYEFRLLIPEIGTVKKRKERRIILF